MVESSVEVAMRTETVDKIVRKAELLSTEQQEKVLEFVERFDSAPRPLFEGIREIVSQIPLDVLEKLPVDGSLNHDHYLYGTPKK